MGSQWPVAQRATVLTASRGIGFTVFKLTCPGTLLNREVIKQEFSGAPSGKHYGSFSTVLPHFSSSPESSLCMGDPQEAAPG